MTEMKTAVSFITTCKNKALIQKLAKKKNMTVSKYVEMIVASKLGSK